MQTDLSKYTPYLKISEPSLFHVASEERLTSTGYCKEVAIHSLNDFKGTKVFFYFSKVKSAKFLSYLNKIESFLKVPQTKEISIVKGSKYEFIYVENPFWYENVLYTDVLLLIVKTFWTTNKEIKTWKDFYTLIFDMYEDDFTSEDIDLSGCICPFKYYYISLLKNLDKLKKFKRFDHYCNGSISFSIDDSFAEMSKLRREVDIKLEKAAEAIINDI